jgi:hypothetical protein
MRDAEIPRERLDRTCSDCHPKHFQQWSGSMHAYASEDPVFVAMNQRGQRETGGALGTFCVKCHAPMASQQDPDNAGASIRRSPRAGITCYFCHNVASITETHNNGLVLANDQTMRGGPRTRVDTPAHHSNTTRMAIERVGDVRFVPRHGPGEQAVELERTFGVEGTPSRPRDPAPP